MSLVTYPKSNESKASGAVSKKRVTQAGSGAPSTFSRRLRNAFAATGRLVINIFDAIAEARVQKAMIEAELYLNRYKHASKNDDDLPVIRGKRRKRRRGESYLEPDMSMIDHPHAIPQTAKRSSFDRRSTSEKPYASGHGRASRRHRAYVVVFVFAIFAAGLAAKFAMSAAIAFNHFR